jgi:hypothetical protein
MKINFGSIETEQELLNLLKTHLPLSETTREQVEQFLNAQEVAYGELVHDLDIPMPTYGAFIAFKLRAPKSQSQGWFSRFFKIWHYRVVFYFNQDVLVEILVDKV